MGPIRFWLKALSKGVGQLNSVAGWAATVILILGLAAGIAVPQVYHHVSIWFTFVVLLALLVAVLALGSYRVWREADPAGSCEGRESVENHKNAWHEFWYYARQCGDPCQ
jgi:hypothetical protein